MKNKEKNKEWLVIFIFLIAMFAIGGTYAFLSIQEYYTGTFEVDIQSKGVDVFVFEKSRDVTLNITEYNFSRGLGHNIVAETSINPTLDTTNKEATICYKIDVNLPEEPVFEYSNGNNPELLLNVMYSIDGTNYEKIIDNMDITTKTGVIPISVINENDNYKHIIETTKNITKKEYYKMQVTFVYYESVDQSINNNKEYSASLTANVIEC